MRWMIKGLLFSAILLVAGVTVYQGSTPEPYRVFDGAAADASAVFSDKTTDFGIDLVHRQGDEYLTGMDETLGSGVCVLDYDNDGWMDLFVVNGAGDTHYYGNRHWWQRERGHHLLRNVDGREFVDVTELAGIQVIGHGMGCVGADFDNDGDADIFITQIGSNILLSNDGDGRYTDVTASSGLNGEGWHTAIAVADVDGDARLDIYVGGFITFDKHTHTYESGSQYHSDAMPFFNPALHPARPNRLYRNLGNLRFDDMTETAGVGNADGRTLSALWSDINDDGRPDLIVANAAGTGSSTGFINMGDWRFRPLGVQARIESGFSYRGLSQADLDRDGVDELLLTGAAGNQTAVLKRSDQPTDAEPRFTDQARQWLITRDQDAGYSPWTALPADFNNDGWPDLLIGNGQLTPDDDAPHVSVGQAKRLWMNTGAAQFKAVDPVALSPLRDHQSARGGALIDVNNDGRLDVFFVHNNDLVQLLINEGPVGGHWLGLQLRDDTGTRDKGRSRTVQTDVVGARVTVTTTDGSQSQSLGKGQGFLSAGDPRLHFGLGAANEARIEVRWPDGGITHYQTDLVDRYLTLSRSAGLQAARVSMPPPATLEDFTRPLDPEVRRSYFAALAGVIDSATGDDTVVQRLRAVMGDMDPGLRLAVVDSLSQTQSKPRLQLLYGFLNDADDRVVAQAIDAVCVYQEERSSRYLLRMFDHPAARVRSHVADCYQHYFKDFKGHQAVIHRKYLAIPHLVAQTNDDDKQARLAAIRALGAAERFRGVAPVARLIADPDRDIQAASIQALGQMRDGVALAPLQDLLQNHELSAEIYAQVFIALKRLDDPLLNSRLVLFSRGEAPFDRLTPVVRLSAFLHVMQLADGAVFRQDDLLDLSATIYESSPGNTDTALIFAKICELSDPDKAGIWLAALSHSDQPPVRLAAYLAQYAQSTTQRATLVARQLQDPDLSVRQGLWRKVTTDKVSLPDPIIINGLAHDETRGLALSAIRHVSSDALKHKLMTELTQPPTPMNTRIAALSALCRAGLKPPASDNGFDTRVEDRWLLAMFACDTVQLPPIYVSKESPAFISRYLQTDRPAVRQAVYDFLVQREEWWAIQKVGEMLDAEVDPELRRHMLAALPPQNLIGRGLLMKRIGDRSEPLRKLALERFRGVDDDNVVTTLSSVAGDANEPMDMRITAASLLPDALRKPALLGLSQGGESPLIP